MQQSAPKILLLEDDASINLGTTEMIEGFGYTVRSCLNVADAVHCVTEEEKPDLAILDVKIGDTTSYVLADWLRLRGVPIIFVTAYDLVAPSSLQDAPVCRKPFREEHLKALMVDVLNRSAS